MTDNFTLYHADCLDIFHTLEPGSIDAVIVDVPYGTTACKWDYVIPFVPMWAGIKHVLKPCGAVVMFSGQPFTSALVMSNIDWFRVEWIWQKEKGTNYLNANRYPMKTHENVIVFCETNPVYNPQKTTGNRYNRTRSRAGDFVEDKTVGGYIAKNDGTRFPHTVQRFNQVKNQLHPTQKPVDLMEYLIRTYTNWGDTVLDFAMGSGSTGVACMKTGRNFVGIEMLPDVNKPIHSEKNPDYFSVAEQRVKNAAGKFVTTANELKTGQSAIWDKI